MKKVIVIGAGTAGLACAVRLQSQGYEVEIFEKNPIPGGKMYQLKNDGYTFDLGPTLVMVPEIYKEVYESAGKNPDDYIKMKKLNPMYSVYFNREGFPRYDLNTDLTELMGLMEKKGTRTALGFQKYLADIYERYQVALEHFITKPFRSSWDVYNPYMLLQALKLKTFDSADHMMSKYLEDQDIRQMLSFQTLYIGVSPKKGPSLYNIIPMIELIYGVWFLEGGMYSMASGMAKLFEELGGKINCNSNVDEIVIENGKAKGIKIGDEIIYSDFVVSNADFPYTISKLVKDIKAKGKYTDTKINKMDYSCSCLIFYWGMAKKYDQIHTHTFIVSSDLDDNLNRIFDGRLIDDASIYLSIPSRGDESMAPKDKDGFYVLIPVSELKTAKYNYDEKIIAHYKENVLKKLEKLPGCENVRNEIISETIITPSDFEMKFNLNPEKSPSSKQPLLTLVRV